MNSNITIPAIEDAIARARAGAPKPITAFALCSEDFEAAMRAVQGNRADVFSRWESISLSDGTVKADDGCPQGSLCWACDDDSLYAETRLNPVKEESPAPWVAKQNLLTALSNTLDRMHPHGPRSGGALESREMSLAITNAEQALMWLEKVPIPE